MHKGLDIIIRYIFAVMLAASASWLLIVISPLTWWFSASITKVMYAVTLVGDGLLVKDVVLQFIPACAAIPAYVLLGLLVLTTRGLSWGNRWLLFLLGSFWVFVINIVRIVVLIIVRIELGKNFFNVVHLFFWHIAASIIVVGIWWWLVKRFHIQSTPVIDDAKELWLLFSR
ncbi:MAG TPA: pacearchaeosortase [Candidatus Nanoarchaeia archaeon]|nr:pacearchaeosortase [Candidatus Nanoarchaeia archaeon]